MALPNSTWIRGVAPLSIWLAASLGMPAVLQAAEVCTLAPGERGRVTAILDGETLKLDTGLVVRLVGVRVTEAGRDRTPAALQASTDGDTRTARGFLERAVLGRAVQLFYGGRRRDRHGRALAHVFVPASETVTESAVRLSVDEAGTDRRERARIWVQGRLVAAGLGLVASFADNRACLSELLDREAGAEAAARGMWSAHPGPVIDARDLRDLFGARHRFRIVEGTVIAAGTVRGTTYLNFDDDWRRDFTIVMRARGRARLNRPGYPDSASLVGRRVRVRGWIDLRNGPFIKVDHPEQLELWETN